MKEHQYLTDEILTVLEDRFRADVSAFVYRQMLHVADALLKTAMASKSDWMEINTVAIFYKYLIPLKTVDDILDVFVERMISAVLRNPIMQERSSNKAKRMVGQIKEIQQAFAEKHRKKHGV